MPDPPFARVQDVVDRVNGLEIPDPYRWLEADDDPEVAAWVAAQNAHARTVLDALPQRSAIRDRLLPLLRVSSVAAPQVVGDRVFTLERGGDLDQAVLTMRPADQHGGGRVVLDPAGTGDPTAALDWYEASPDGRLVAYGLSFGGDERSTLHVLDVDAGTHLPDTIPRTRAASIAWLPDGSGFGYTRYPDPETLPEEDRGYWRQVWWHTVGEDPAQDRLVFGDLPDRTAWPDVSISTDGRWLLIHVAVGWSRVDVHLIDRTTGERAVVVAGREEVSGFTVVDDRLVGHTTLGARRGRVVSAPLATPAVDRWRTIVPQSERVIEGLVTTARSILVAGTLRATATLQRHDLDGRNGMEIDLPGLGSVAGLTGSDTDDRAFLSFTSFTRSPQLFRWEPSGLEPWTAAPTGVEPDDFSVEQVGYSSPDGTEISMFLIRRRDTVLSPETPTILTGYGGFAVTMGPAYSPAVVEVCTGGGLYAVAGLRGGGEEGEAWHRAGTRQHKQRVFDDFCAAADWLVAQGLTSRRRLAIRGGSNGGLLVGAAITQRPDLCRAAHCAVPLLDMARYHRFLIARLWIPEYGDPDVPEELAWLLAYSPYHRVVDGVCYPAVLFTSGEEDSRVHPAHARKMAARLQAATSCGDERPVLLQIEARAGHGQGKPVAMQVDELADVLAFLWWQLGV